MGRRYGALYNIYCKLYRLICNGIRSIFCHYQGFGWICSYLCSEKSQKEQKRMNDDNNNNQKIDWGKVIQVAIAILTVISGMFFESCTGSMEGLRAMLM